MQGDVSSIPGNQSADHPLALLPALGVTLVALMFGAAASYAPPETGEMAVVFAPGTSEVAAYVAIIAAGGRIVSTSRFENIVIAYALDPGFQHRIGKLGGWFTLSATGLCSPTNPTIAKSSDPK